MKTPLIVVAALATVFAVGCSKKKSSPIQSGGVCAVTYVADWNEVSEKRDKVNGKQSIETVSAVVKSCEKLLASHGQTACNASINGTVKAISYNDHQTACDGARTLLASHASRQQPPSAPVVRTGSDASDDRLVTQLPADSLKLKVLSNARRASSGREVVSYNIIDNGSVQSVFSRKNSSVFCGFHSYADAPLKPGTVYRLGSTYEQPSALTARAMTWMTFADRGGEDVFVDCWTKKRTPLKVSDLKTAFRGIFEVIVSEN